MDQGEDRRTQDGPEVLDRGPRRRVVVVLAVVVAVVLVVLAAWRVGTQRSAPPPSPSPSRSGPATPGAGPGNNARKDTVLRLSWLHATTDYDLFLRTADAVYRLRPRSGIGVRTAVPGLGSSGPVAFLPLAGAALIAPLDQVAGYLVPDDGRPRQYGNGGQTFPGPDHRHLWAEQVNLPNRFRLTEVATGATGSTVSVPDTREMLSVASDGQGHLVATNEDGSYDGAYLLRPGHRPRVIGGRLIGSGPGRLLVTEKRCQHDCTVRVLGPDDRPLADQPEHPLTVDADAARAVVAADRRTAALWLGPDKLVLIELGTGRRIHTDVTSAGGEAMWAFSPDSRWLFAVGDDRRVHVIDTHSGRSRTLPGPAGSGPLEGVRQLTVRP